MSRANASRLKNKEFHPATDRVAGRNCLPWERITFASDQPVKAVENEPFCAHERSESSPDREGQTQRREALTGAYLWGRATRFVSSETETTARAATQFRSPASSFHWGEPPDEVAQTTGNRASMHSTLLAPLLRVRCSPPAHNNTAAPCPSGWSTSLRDAFGAPAQWIESRAVLCGVSAGISARHSQRTGSRPPGDSRRRHGNERAVAERAAIRAQAAGTVYSARRRGS